MDRKFLQYYNLELQHLRQTAAEFAQEYPKIASRLALDPEGKEVCPDPFVERLLEGFAYLTARVQLKLDAEFPRLTNSLLETVYPEYLSPTPSMAVVRFEPDFKNKALAGGYLIPRGTTIRSMPVGKDAQTRCTYRSAHNLTLWPVQMRDAQYIDRNLLSLELPVEDVGAAILMTFDATAELTFADIPFEHITLFLRGTDNLPSNIMEHILAQGTAVWVRDPMEKQKGWRKLPKGSIRPVGLDRTESLLPETPTTFEGYRLLMEYLAFPQRYLFLRIAGLSPGLVGLSGTSLEIAITLDRANPKLAPRINKTVFDMYCSPIINLFEKRTDRIDLSDRFSEFHVVVDRTRPVDFEVFSIKSVTGYGGVSGEEQEFRSFYQTRDAGSASPAYYTIDRKRRLLSDREKKFGRMSAYTGSEVYLSLVDSSSAPYSSNLEQLGVTALCTNRHLPLRISQGDGAAEFAVELNGPVKAVRCVSGPTEPRPSFAIGETAWRLISHLSLNYLSLMDTSEADGASSLRELLQLYLDPEDRSAQRLVDGVLSVRAKPILRRVPSPGVISFARGLEVTVVLDDEAFTGYGIFVFGMVLEQFFSKHVAINSFTETVIKSKQRGEIIRWPARTGKKEIL